MKENVLPHIQKVLNSLDNCTDEQKEALLYHFECLLSALAACISAKYAQNTPDIYHDSYLQVTGKNIMENTKTYLWQASPLGYIDPGSTEQIIEALQKEIDITTKNAKGDIRTFSDWHTV